MLNAHSAAQSAYPSTQANCRHMGCSWLFIMDTGCPRAVLVAPLGAIGRYLSNHMFVGDSKRPGPGKVHSRAWPGQISENQSPYE
jgi:hypothetical protein